MEVVRSIVVRLGGGRGEELVWGRFGGSGEGEGKEVGEEDEEGGEGGDFEEER